MKEPNEDWINQPGYVLKIQEAKEAIPKDVAKEWLRLKARGCLPDWAIRQVKEEKVQMAAM